MPDPAREESTCRWCGQPTWLVHHGKHSNHTVEGRAVKQRDEELVQRLLSEKAKAAGAARLRNRNSMLPWRELGPSLKRAEIEAAGHVIKGALDSFEEAG